MPEPTKEIIELARELKQIGYRQEIKRGNWAVIKGELFVNPLPQPYPKRPGDIPITSISDGVDFLRKNKSPYFPNLFTEKPHEEMLKSMIIFLKQKERTKCQSRD